ncbi:MAG: hypothetical protein KAG56_06180 [Sulfurovaceae bacterium]|nr:hypothetical protein [Sulfurovaceae bacterium]
MREILMTMIIILFVGCSKLNLKNSIPPQPIEQKPLSCNEKASPKSLELLEQNYRCNNN